MREASRSAPPRVDNATAEATTSTAPHPAMSATSALQPTRRVTEPNIASAKGAEGGTLCAMGHGASLARLVRWLARAIVATIRPSRRAPTLARKRRYSMTGGMGYCANMAAAACVHRLQGSMLAFAVGHKETDWLGPACAGRDPPEGTTHATISELLHRSPKHCRRPAHMAK